MIRKLSPRNIEASLTNVVVTPEHGVGRDADKDGTIRVDLMLGQVADTPQFTLQQSDGTAWENVETIEAAANAGTTCTFTAGSTTVTATSHGLHEGQLVTFATSGQLPGAIRGGHLYYVRKVVSANAVEVLPHNVVGFKSDIPEDTGSGTHKLIPVVHLSAKLIPTIVADQPYLPARRSFRWIATTALGETAQVIGMVIR